MKKIKYLFIPVSGEPEIREYKLRFSIKEELNEEAIYCIDHAYLGRNLYLYFDDEGIKHYLEERIEYNFNIPSAGKFSNMIFGNAMVEKVDQFGNSIDITHEDVDYVKKTIFKLTKDKVIFEIGNIMLNFKRHWRVL